MSLHSKPNLPPKPGTPIVVNLWTYWSLSHKYVYTVPYKLTDADYVPLAIEVPVEIIVTEDVMAKLAQKFEAAKADAFRQYQKRVDDLNRLQSQYLAIEMSPTEE